VRLRSVTGTDGHQRAKSRLEEVLGAAVRGELSSVVDAHIGLFCRVGGVVKAPVMVVVQPVIKHERRGAAGRARTRDCVRRTSRD